MLRLLHGSPPHFPTSWISPRAHAVLTCVLHRSSLDCESLLILASIYFLPLPNQIGAGSFLGRKHRDGKTRHSGLAVTHIRRSCQKEYIAKKNKYWLPLKWQRFDVQAFLFEICCTVFRTSLSAPSTTRSPGTRGIRLESLEKWQSISPGMTSVESSCVPLVNDRTTEFTLVSKFAHLMKGASASR
jgi:hypothetical protein